MNTITEFIDNKADTTIVSFTGMHHAIFGCRTSKQEFRGLLKQSECNVMFVEDKDTSWFNNIDVDKIKSKLNNQKVITLGNSMGAYSAIQFANDFNVTKVIAFAPQYSVHPDIVPDEKRWKSKIKKIKQWKYKHLMFNDITEYYIFSGNCKVEMYHTNMMPNQQNIHKFIMQGCHDIAAILKTKGILYSLIEDCICETIETVTEKYEFGE